MNTEENMIESLKKKKSYNGRDWKLIRDLQNTQFTSKQRNGKWNGYRTGQPIPKNASPSAKRGRAGVVRSALSASHAAGGNAKG